MKQYQSFKDIETDLKRLKLERDIAFEEMKLIKTEFKENLKPVNWIGSTLSTIGKYGIWTLIKRFIRK
ncbi:hypothetical protein C1T31_12910 [Hanstruepera neustonica]|uniref:Glutaminyl-tRNA synthetase n=1 Tax=Hanstruepera neustonica TaxID=1445657 RepID=A0A2K1DW16_9FLAO|nr:DUF6327 family protein [Hanstruepera neustonica]PNQ72220.1 hypothetical protein C1T31_12910 [Hanstruepera neustonica]